MRSYTFILGLAAALVAGSAFGADMTPVGKWKTVDDKTGKEKSIVEITETGGVLTGKILQILNPDEKGPNPMCEACSGERKDKPVVGMIFIWDVRKDGDVWDGGSILDPKNGKTYSVKITPSDDGSKLQVRGFIGWSLLGRTQVWSRVTQ